MSDYAGVLFPIHKPRVTLPFADTTYKAYRWNPHKGVDLSPFPGSTGELIRASTTGKVQAANLWGNDQAIGNEVVIRTSVPYSFGANDENGAYHETPARQEFWFRYGHLDSVFVKTGQEVRAGDVIGTIGTTGMAFGAHLHLELRIRDYKLRKVVDPMHFFVASIVGLRDAVVTVA